MTKHTWDICDLCGFMVRCGYCGNNCCNGGTGQIDGKDCGCAEAYKMQNEGLKAIHDLLKRQKRSEFVDRLLALPALDHGAFVGPSEGPPYD